MDIYLKGISVFQSCEQIRIGHILISRIRNPAEQHNRYDSSDDTEYTDDNRRRKLHTSEGAVLVRRIKFDTQHAHHPFFIMHRKISDKNITPACMLDLFGEHYLVLHGHFHIRNAFRLNGISYITKIFALNRQSVHQIDKGTVFFFFCGIQIPDACGCPDIFQSLFCLLIKIRCAVCPAVQPPKGFHIQSAVRILINAVCPGPERPYHAVIGKAVTHHKGDPARDHHNNGRHKKNL